jgi:putative alpha-1,2-mannosidase
MTEFYTNSPAGLCGNDDVGQMSAWYVFSAMGFYPLNAMSGVYVFGSPMMQHANINYQMAKL